MTLVLACDTLTSWWTWRDGQDSMQVEDQSVQQGVGGGQEGALTLSSICRLANVLNAGLEGSFFKYGSPS
jgi:hypothetical protein